MLNILLLCFPFSLEHAYCIIYKFGKFFVVQYSGSRNSPKWSLVSFEFVCHFVIAVEAFACMESFF